MLRKLLLVVVVTSLGSLTSAESVQGRQWSKGNPGIYGNIHGLTYRSSKWERENGSRNVSRKQTVRRSRVRLFRRR